MKINRIEERKSFLFDASGTFVDYRGLEWCVGIQLKSSSGRPEVAAVAIWSESKATPITRRTLREIPLDSIFGEVVQIEKAALSQLSRKRSLASSHQGRLHSDEELRHVAEIYTTAYENRLPVQRTVAKTLGVSESTAKKRIAAARRRGFLIERSRS